MNADSRLRNARAEIGYVQDELRRRKMRDEVDRLERVKLSLHELMVHLAATPQTRPKR